MQKFLALVAIFFSQPLAAEEGKSDWVSQNEMSVSFVEAFRTICFEIDWKKSHDVIDMGSLSFERLPDIEGVRRYTVPGLYLAYFLSAPTISSGSLNCRLETGSGSSGQIRHAISNWKMEGEMVADEIQDGQRVTMWKIGLNSKCNLVYMLEETRLLGEKGVPTDTVTLMRVEKESCDF